MDLTKALFEAEKQRDISTEMVEVFNKAIEATETLSTITKLYDEKKNYVAEVERKITQYNESAASAKVASNEAISTLSEKKREAKAAINAEKDEAVKEKEVVIEEINTKVRGREANLLMLEKREKELKDSIVRMETTIKDQYKMVSK